jgi:hypothetical protein
MYFKKVGLEIFRYSIASLVVKTKSLSSNGIRLASFFPAFLGFTQITSKSHTEEQIRTWFP